jgi:hypothetical protein
MSCWKSGNGTTIICPVGERASIELQTVKNSTHTQILVFLNFLLCNSQLLAESLCLQMRKKVRLGCSCVDEGGMVLVNLMVVVKSFATVSRTSRIKSENLQNELHTCTKCRNSGSFEVIGRMRFSKLSPSYRLSITRRYWRAGASTCR